MIEAVVSAAYADLLRDEIGWQRLGEDLTSVDLTPSERQSIIALARRYWRRDPVTKQTVRLWTNFALGQGLSYSVPGDEDAVAALKAFWNLPGNADCCSVMGQHKSSRRLLIDGDVFFAVFLGGEGHTPKIRRIDPVQINRIICNPEDASEPWGYERIVPSSASATIKKEYYLDMMHHVQNAVGDRTLPLPSGPGETSTKEGVVVLHVAFEDTDLWGSSLLEPMIPWMRTHRKFMEARSAVQQAVAMFAWKRTRKGTPTQVQAAITAMRSALVAGDTERNYPPSPGSTWVENESDTLQPMKFETGAAAAKDDSAMLLQMAGVGGGIFPHYYGAGEAFRLATATAMELPMLKMFQGYQQLWREAYARVFEAVLLNAGMENVFVDIDFGAIVTKDVPAIITALGTVADKFPIIASTKEVQALLLTLLEINNVEDVMAALLKPPAKPSGSPGPEQSEAEAAAGLARSVAALRRVLTEASREAPASPIARADEPTAHRGRRVG